MGGAVAAPPVMVGALGPAWTQGDMEKPAGLKHVNSCTMAVYTPEQQTRLGVDEHGQKTTANNADAAGVVTPALVGERGGVGPAWTRSEIEKPAGTKDMGTWSAAVYTEEQQTRLGVDEQGKKN